MEKKFRPMVLSGNSEAAVTDDLYLQGLIMKACSQYNLHYTNAFLYSTGKNSQKPMEKYNKIQNEVFFEAFASICREESACSRTECHFSDAVAAECILEHEYEKFDKYKCLENISYISDSNKKRNGILYVCSRTGYNEIAFPVKLFDSKVAVLIVGQIVTKENMEVFQERTGKLYKDLGKTEKEINKILSDISIVEKIQEVIDKMSLAVEYIEDDLKECYKKRQTIYNLEMSNSLIEDFKQKIPNIKHESEAMQIVYPAIDKMTFYNGLGEEIRTCLGNLCSNVGAKHFAIFLPDIKNMIYNSYDEMVNHDMTINTNRCLKDKTDGNFICDDLTGYIKNMNYEYDFLLISDVETYPIAIAVCRKDFLPEASDEERKLLKTSLGEIFNRFTSYAQMAGVEAKSEYYRVYLDSAMSIMRHELGQSNAGYGALIEKFKTFRRLYSEKLYNFNLSHENISDIERFLGQCDLFVDNSECYMHTTKLRIQSTKYLIDFKPNNPRLFYPYEEFLFKWHQIYYNEAEKEGLEFNFPEVSISDYSRPRMFGDPDMIEQAAYNLTNNAIKYAIRGTAISMDCKLNTEKNRYEIVVVNLGYSLKSNEEIKSIFEYGKRGSNNSKKGSGLGLYLTRQIARSHGGDVECDMEKLSDYDLTLIEYYIQAYNSAENKYFCKDAELYERLLEELRTKRTEISKYIVKKLPENEFVPMFVQNGILKGISKFTFTFWIPYDKKQRG